MTKNQMYLLKTYQGTLLSKAFDDVEEFFINAVMTIIVKVAQRSKFIKFLSLNVTEVFFLSKSIPL
jgi:hypothetical protein